MRRPSRTGFAAATSAASVKPSLLLYRSISYGSTPLLDQKNPLPAPGITGMIFAWSSIIKLNLAYSLQMKRTQACDDHLRLARNVPIQGWP